jgi:hypothetical protein
MPFVLLEADMTPEGIAKFLEAAKASGAFAESGQTTLSINDKGKIEAADDDVASTSSDEEVSSKPSGDEEDSDKDKEDIKEEDLKPKGSIAEAKHLYEDKPDDFGKTLWTAEEPCGLADPPENAVSAQFALLVRNVKCYNGRDKLKVHSLVVQSARLKTILGKVLAGYPGVSTTQLSRLEFEPPFQAFVHRWQRLEQARDDEEDAETKQHLTLLTDVLKKELAEAIQDRNDLIANRVARYETIWALFEPGTLVYSNTGDGDVERVYKFKKGEFRCTQDHGPHYALDCQYVDFDGENFGYGRRNLIIPKFNGTNDLAQLAVLPLDFHPNKAEVKRTLIERGQRWAGLTGYTFKHYHGIGLEFGQWGMVRYSINGRMIIDTHAFNRFNPNYAARLMSLSKGDNMVETSTGGGDGGGSDGIHNNCFYDEDYEFNSKTKEGDISNKKRKPTVELTEQQHLIATHELRGYSLKDKKWLVISVGSVKEITWSVDAFQSLVAPEEQKQLILAFARSQMKHKDCFDDVIQGKGRGIIMLLSGPPGVGKTLTAESVAETMKVPLYSLSAGDLGTSPYEVEQNLSNILEMNNKWNAVLLLDEADVFLEARSSEDLERNKIVSIFLRLLEYYEGILFLTTNRVENMDAAFESRIHLSLQYHDLDVDSRLHIWKTFLGRAGGMSNFSVEQINGLAAHDMNGRQIKNVLKAAQLLASERGTPMGYSDVDTVMRVRLANVRKIEV